MEKTKNKRKKSGREPRSWRFNFLDAIILLVIVLFIAAVVLLFIPRVTSFLGSNGDVDIVYTVVFRGVDASVEISDQQKVVDAKTERVLGMVEGSPETEDYYELVRDAENVSVLKCEKVDGKIDLIVTISASAMYVEGRGYEVNGCRIACNKEFEMVFPGFAATGTCIEVTERNAQ